MRDHVGGGRAGSAHAHIEGSVEAEREAAFGRIDLHGRDAEVEHDAIGELDPEIACDAIERGEFAFDQSEAPGRGLDLGARRRDRRGVAIDTDDLRIRRRKDRGGVAAGTESAVDIDAAVMGSEAGNDLAEQHGDMAPRRCGRRWPGIAPRHGRKAGQRGACPSPGPAVSGIGALRLRRDGRRGTATPLSIMANPMQPKVNRIGWR